MTLCHELNQRQPPNRSSTSYTPCSAARRPAKNQQMRRPAHQPEAVPAQRRHFRRRAERRAVCASPISTARSGSGPSSVMIGSVTAGQLRREPLQPVRRVHLRRRRLRRRTSEDSRRLPRRASVTDCAARPNGTSSATNRLHPALFITSPSP